MFDNYKKEDMPLLNIQTNLPELSESDLILIQEEGSQILSEEIGKSIDFVMVLCEAGRNIYFSANSTEPAAFIEIKNVGALSSSLSSSITQKLSVLLKRVLSIPPSRCYLEFQESERHLWGWNGKTFAS